MSVVFSPAARDDLVEIALFIAEDNPKRALSFVDELEDKGQVVGRSPTSARSAQNSAKAS